MAKDPCCTCPPHDPNPAHQVGTWDCPVHHSPEYLARLADVLVPRIDVPLTIKPIRLSSEDEDA